MIISHLILGMVYGAETSKWIHMVYGIGFTTNRVCLPMQNGAFLVDKQTHPLDLQQTHSRNLSGQNLQVLLILDAARASAHGPWCQNMFEMTSQWPICCRWGFHDVQRFTSDFQPFQFSWVC